MVAKPPAAKRNVGRCIGIKKATSLGLVVCSILFTTAATLHAAFRQNVATACQTWCSASACAAAFLSRKFRLAIHAVATMTAAPCRLRLYPSGGALVAIEPGSKRQEFRPRALRPPRANHPRRSAQTSSNAVAGRGPDHHRPHRRRSPDDPWRFDLGDSLHDSARPSCRTYSPEAGSIAALASAHSRAEVSRASASSWLLHPVGSEVHAKRETEYLGEVVIKFKSRSRRPVSPETPILTSLVPGGARVFASTSGSSQSAR